MEGYQVLYEFYGDKLSKYFSVEADPERFEKYKKKFKALIDNINDKNLSGKKRLQYDKDETIVTLYTFLTLGLLSSNASFYRVWEPILKKAFNDESVSERIRNRFSKGFNLFLEFSLTPNDFIKKAIDPWGKNHQ